jgi:hypothetical protein
VCVPTGAHCPTSVFILTLQACVWFVHRLAAETLNTTTLSMRERGLNATSEWASGIAGCKSFQDHGMKLIWIVNVNFYSFLKFRQFVSYSDGIGNRYSVAICSSVTEMTFVVVCLTCVQHRVCTSRLEYRLSWLRFPLGAVVRATGSISKQWKRVAVA